MKMVVEPRRDFFIIYFAANVYAVLFLLITGTFLGFESVRVNNISVNLFLFISVFLLSYYFLLFPVFNFFSKLSFGIRHTFNSENKKSILFLDFSVFLLQAVYFAFVLVFDAGKVGVEDAVVPLSSFWALVQIDFLALYYLTLVPKSNFWKANFWLYAISNLVRGWTGFLLILVFIYLIKKEKPFVIRLKKFLFYFCFGLIFLPLLLYAKFYIRTRQADLNFDEFIDIVFGFDGYWDFFVYSAQYFANRLQQFSLTWFVWEASDALSFSYANGFIAPFWAENLYGNFISKTFGDGVLPNLGIFAAQYMPYEFDVVVGSFNISPGLIGWMGVVGVFAAGFAIYLAFLFGAGFLLIQLICKRGSIEWVRLRLLLWLMWLFLLVPGWMNQFVGFLHAAVIFLIIISISKITKG